MLRVPGQGNIMKEFSYETKPRACTPGEGERCVTANVRFERGGNSEPYLSITGTVFIDRVIQWERPITWRGQGYWPYQGGCVHETIAESFPELAPHLRWHLASPSGPMHYVANGIYHHENWGNEIAGEPWAKGDNVDLLRARFCDTVVYDPAQDESLDDILVFDEQDLRRWLEARLPRLQREYRESIEKLRAFQGELT